MAAGNGAAGHVGSPIVPYAQRPAGFFVPGIETTPLAPQGERRAQDSATCAAILHIARKVDGHCRSVFLTDCVYRIGITERVDVSRSNLRRKTRLIRAPSSERIVHNYFRIRHDQPFGQRLWLSKERP